MNTIDFLQKLNYQLDMAKEAHDYLRGDSDKEIPGVKEEVEQLDIATISTITILNEEGEKIMGKPMGTYITIDAPDVLNEPNKYEEIGFLIAKQLKPLLTISKDQPILMVGLGNIDAIPDALGPMVIDKSIATRHIIEQLPDALPDGFHKVALINTSVLGRTGIESYEIIKGVVKEINPSCIIVIDSLVSASLTRVASSFQISSAGVKPGSGIGNHRMAVNEETLGVPCIAIGVPLLVHGEIIVKEALTLLKNYLISNNEPAEVTDQINPNMAMAIMKSLLGEENGNIAVTPKDINTMVIDCSQAVSIGINLSIHDYLNESNYYDYLGK